MDATSRTIRDRLHPKQYPQAAEEVDGIPLLLIRQSWFGSKYALAVVPYQSQSATAQKGRVRRTVDEFTDSSFFAPCGLIILFVAPEPDWPASDAVPEPDRHTLRSTIVQGLAWLDPETGKYKYRMGWSAWGPLKFGNAQAALQALLDEWPLTNRSSERACARR